MTKRQKGMVKFVANFEKTSAAKLRDLQVSQSFDGTLRIKLDRVYVDRNDGKRALDQLRTFSTGRFVKAG